MRRALARWAVCDRQASVRLACKTFLISRTSYDYVAKRTADDEIIDVLVRLAASHPRWGFGLMLGWLRNRAITGITNGCIACTAS